MLRYFKTFYQDPIKLIQTIVTIPDDLCVPITKNMLINKAIEVANTITHNIEKSKALRNISNTLLKLKDIDRAIQAANTIPNNTTKSWALEDIRRYEQRNQCSCTVS